MSAVKEWATVMPSAYAEQEHDHDSHPLTPVAARGSLEMSESTQWEQEQCAARFERKRSAGRVPGHGLARTAESA